MGSVAFCCICWPARKGLGVVALGNVHEALQAAVEGFALERSWKNDLGCEGRIVLCEDPASGSRAGPPLTPAPPESHTTGSPALQGSSSVQSPTEEIGR